MAANLIRGHLDSLLLAVLLDEPGHGYAVSQRLTERGGGELGVPEGSLYPALQRLERLGLLRSSWAEVDGRRRRVYTVTATGRREATSAAREWRSFSTAVDRLLGGLA